MAVVHNTETHVITTVTFVHRGLQTCLH